MVAPDGDQAVNGSYDVMNCPVRQVAAPAAQSTVALFIKLLSFKSTLKITTFIFLV